MLHKDIIESHGFKKLDGAQLEAVVGGYGDTGLEAPTIHGEGGDPETLPTTWDDMSWGETICWGGAYAISGGDEYFADLACGTDLTGDNPDQTGLSEEEQERRDQEALEAMADALVDAANDATGN